jgi:hypothetical protein
MEEQQIKSFKSFQVLLIKIFKVGTVPYMSHFNLKYFKFACLGV